MPFYGDNVAGCTDFVSARSTVVFNKQSRAFERMKNFIGGEPYFYFTVLAALYNEFLTNRAANALSNLQPGMLIGASPLKSTKAELESRYEIFVAHLRPMIPNLFRYNVESTLLKRSMTGAELPAGRKRSKESSRGTRPSRMILRPQPAALECAIQSPRDRSRPLERIWGACHWRRACSWHYTRTCNRKESPRRLSIFPGIHPKL